MTYRLRIPKSVLRELERLPGHMRQRVRRAIAGLSQEPRPQAAKALRGELTGHWRLRVEDHRIIYSIDDDTVVVEIIRVARRSASTYEGL